MHRVFVFGTLKNGFPLHARGLGGANFMGRYRTVEAYPMLVAGPWFAPMMLDRPGSGLSVTGELYQVDEPRLRLLDKMESVCKPGNFRRLIEVRRLDGGDVRTAYVFMKAAELAKPEHSGYLEDYQDSRFIPPDRRSKRVKQG